MPHCYKPLIVLILLFVSAPVSAQVGIFSRVKFGSAFLDASSNCATLTAPTGSFCTDTDDGTVWTRTPGGWVQITGAGGGGTTTSVALSMPAIFSVSGSPVTTAGTLTANLVTQAANRVFAGPTTGANDTPAFRALVLDDLPSITSAKITDATIVFADWASNSCASGEIPKYNGSAWVCGADAGASSGAPSAAQYVTLANDGTLTNERVLTAGSGISLVDAGAGSTLTIATTGAANAYPDFTDPQIPTFTAINAGSATIGDTTIQGAPAITLTEPSHATDELHIWKKAVPAVPYTVTLAMMPTTRGTTTHCGAVWRQSSDGKVITISYDASRIISYKFTNATTYSGSTYFVNNKVDFGLPTGGIQWLRLADNNTNRIVSICSNVNDCVPIHTVIRTDYLTADEIGIYCDDFGSVGAFLTVLSYEEN